MKPEILLAVMAGGALPIQASMNAQVLRHLGNPVLAGLVSLLVGQFLLFVTFFVDIRTDTTATDSSLMAIVSQPSSSGIIAPSVFCTGQNGQKTKPCGRLVLTLPELTWQKFSKAEKYLLVTPGLIAASFIILGAELGHKLGFSLFFVTVVSGQLLAAAVVDNFGWFGFVKRPTGCYRLVMLTAVLAGAIISASDRIKIKDRGDNAIVGTLCFMVLSFGGGLLLAVQAPMNARLQKQLDLLPHRIAFISSSAGTLITGLVILPIYLAVKELADVSSTTAAIDFQLFKDIEWWQFLGGFLGSAYLASSILLSRRIGVAMFFVAAIAGQLISSLLIDCFGLFGSNKIEVSGTRTAGLVLVFLSVVCFRFEADIKKAVDDSQEQEETSKTQVSV